MKRIICLTTLVLLASTATLADIARPDPGKTPKQNPSKSIKTGMNIKLDREATPADVHTAVDQARKVYALYGASAKIESREP